MGSSLKEVDKISKDDFWLIKKDKSKSSRAVGLIQFTQAALVQIGEFTNGSGFDKLHEVKLKFAKMGEIKQLDYVKKYFQSAKDKIKTPEDIYLHVFAPSGVNQKDDFVLYTKGTEEYRQNKSIDEENNGDGKIQRSEILGRYNKSKSGGQSNKASTFNCSGSLNSVINAKDIVTYRIYSDGRIEKHIPKVIKEEYKTKYKYVYHDIKNIQHEICEVDWIEVDKRNDGETIASIPKGHIKTYDYPSGGNAQKAYVYSNDDICVEGTEYGYKKYPKGKGKVQLVKMKDNLKYKSGKIKIFYSFKDSQRRYCNPDTYAAFIGALADIGREDVKCTGMCFSDATSYPSVTHPNADSADTSYFSTLDEEQIKVNAFKKFHFEHIYRGKTGWYSDLKQTAYSKGHEDHLHSGDFNSNKIIIIK